MALSFLPFPINRELWTEVAVRYQNRIGLDLKADRRGLSTKHKVRRDRAPRFVDSNDANSERSRCAPEYTVVMLTPDSRQCDVWALCMIA